MRAAVPAHDAVAAVQRTGFPLEHLITRALQARNWGVISNRYYADDVDGRARELDLIAYKTFSTEECDYITAILVSCKKDAENSWALMSRTKPESDPNNDWEPVHFWTNVPYLRLHLANTAWKDEYNTKVTNSTGGFLKAQRDIFAFQVIAPKPNGAVPRNDEPIFKSLEGLFKALDYEVTALDNRMAKPRVYQFNLAVLADCPLIEVDFDADEPVAREIGHAVHFARYMVKKRHLSALVHFVRRDRFAEFVAAADTLAFENRNLFNMLRADAKSALPGEEWARKHYANQLSSRILQEVNSTLGFGGIESTADQLSFQHKDDILCIEVGIFDTDSVAALNDDDMLCRSIRYLLSAHAHYRGDFKFTSDCPF
jgi:hypothetical protein